MTETVIKTETDRDRDSDNDRDRDTETEIDRGRVKIHHVHNSDLCHRNKFVLNATEAADHSEAITDLFLTFNVQSAMKPVSGRTKQVPPNHK